MSELIYDLEAYKAKARQAVAEGVVLLKNDDNVLPLKQGSTVALFGRSQFNYYKSGTGSGGLVNTKYVVSILDAMESDEGYILNQYIKGIYSDWIKEHPFEKGAGWGQEPWSQEEMPLSEEWVKQARQQSETAIIIIGRTAGEDQDNSAKEGSYLLTEAEEKMLQLVCSEFERSIVLLNVGNIIDMKWVERYNPTAVMYVWHGGQEGGNGVLDVLTGKVSPSGRLADTIAQDILDYPSTANHGDEKRNVYVEDIYVGYRYFETFKKESVLYPFGYGLSYTTFDTSVTQVTQSNDGITITASVTNTGSIAGKQVVQVYCQAPQGKLGKPARVLVGFAKTEELQSGEKREVELSIPYRALASYDDSGVTGNKSAWVLEAGSYAFYVGDNVREAQLSGSIEFKELQLLEQCQEAMAPITEFERMYCTEDGKLAYQPVPLQSVDPQARRLENLPEEIQYTGDKGYKLADVNSGKVSMDEFIAQLSDEDLVTMVRGEGMCSPKVTPGTAGAFGGVTDKLTEFGIPTACCADGPSGIRMDNGNKAFSLPNGACLGSTFNEALQEELYAYQGLELRKNAIETLLGPGINIHRSPLNGRNFEYFSEDPLLTGRMAAAQLRGMHQYGVTGTIKHFACNSQEMKRHEVEAVVSERALREIYLRGFEIAVKEGECVSIMTAYNPINGYWSASNYDLNTTILRQEWGFTGIVMTDWWAKGNDEGKLGDRKNIAAMIRAQNDLYMVVNDAATNSHEDNSQQALKDGTVTRGEYQRTAKNICNYLMTTVAFNRIQGIESELDKALSAIREDEGDVVLEMLPINVDQEAVIPGETFNTDRGESTHFQALITERGFYQLELTIRAAAGNSELAQLPVSIFRDSSLLKTITLTGADQEWNVFTIDLEQPLVMNNAYFRVMFGQSGMEVKDFKIRLTKSMEEEIRKFFASQV